MRPVERYAVVNQYIFAAGLHMVVVREFLYPLQNYNVVALTYIAAKTNIVRPISVTREASGKR